MRVYEMTVNEFEMDAFCVIARVCVCVCLFVCVCVCVCLFGCLVVWMFGWLVVWSFAQTYSVVQLANDP